MECCAREQSHHGWICSWGPCCQDNSATIASDIGRDIRGSSPWQQGEPTAGALVRPAGFDHHQARRMCFSSTCAMLLAFLKPGVLTGPNGDDQYLARVRQFGDTTDPAAQIKALASYSISARFSKQARFSTLEEQIAAGIPVPCGYLHRGPVSSPAGGAERGVQSARPTPPELDRMEYEPVTAPATRQGNRRGQARPRRRVVKNALGRQDRCQQPSSHRERANASLGAALRLRLPSRQ